MKKLQALNTIYIMVGITSVILILKDYNEIPKVVNWFEFIVLEFCIQMLVKNFLNE